ncbi:MAG TPA: hypothetical protein VGW78_01330 [Candidatus Babeliales bacterium]|jgi:hypothetical protein|nr:hypothetical protein [Candidatus Babeliales bacterium]
MIQQKTRIYYSLAGLLLFSHINMSAMFHNYMLDTKKALYIGGLVLAAGLGSLGMYLYQNKGIKQKFNTLIDSCEKIAEKLKRDEEQKRTIGTQELIITSLQETVTTLRNEKFKIEGECLGLKSILEAYREAIKVGELIAQPKPEYNFINILKTYGEEL